MEFVKLPKLPKGSSVFQSVIEDIEREKHVEEELDASSETDLPRSRANSQSQTKSSNQPRWLKARACLTKQSMYRVVVLAKTRRK